MGVLQRAPAPAPTFLKIIVTHAAIAFSWPVTARDRSTALLLSSRVGQLAHCSSNAAATRRSPRARPSRFDSRTACRRWRLPCPSSAGYLFGTTRTLQPGSARLSPGVRHAADLREASCLRALRRKDRTTRSLDGARLEMFGRSDRPQTQSPSGRRSSSSQLAFERQTRDGQFVAVSWACRPTRDNSPQISQITQIAKLGSLNWSVSVEKQTD